MRSSSSSYWNRTAGPSALLVAGVFVACSGAEDAAPKGFSYASVTDADIVGVQSGWAERDLESRDVELVLQDDDEPLYTVRIYRHSIGSNAHYGAVVVPKPPASTPYPVVLFADGLDQQYPVMSVQGVLKSTAAAATLGRSVLLIPSFRGRTLTYDEQRFSSGGDFCDAYDGAADDAIAFTNAAEGVTPEAAFDRVFARGGSRGGNTVLLLGERDTRVRVVDATAAPVDFNRRSVREAYGSQYECQFFANKSAAQARERILASSPLYFRMLPEVERVVLHHGAVDSVVPAWNAEEMYARLAEQDVDVQLHVYEGLGHSDVYRSPDYRDWSEQALAEFSTKD